MRAEPGLAILSSQFDADPWLLNVENVTIDLKTGKLRPHCAGDLITKLAPVLYDRDAKCPRWEQFLAEVITDPETIPWVAKAKGYSATGDCSERVAFFVTVPRPAERVSLWKRTKLYSATMPCWLPPHC